MQLGHPSPSGPRGLPAQSHQVDHWLPIVWGRAFLRAFLAESRIILASGWEPFLSQYIFALSNPFLHQDIYLLTLYLFISGLFMSNPFFMVLSILSIFMTSHFFSHLLHCWEGCSENQVSSTLRPWVIAQWLKRDMPDFWDNNLTIQHLPQFNTCGCLLTF